MRVDDLIEVKSKRVVENKISTTPLDMVIAFDVTGSMELYINTVKKDVTTLVTSLLESNPQLQIGIVAFGDYCDMASREVFGAAYQVCPLTSDKDELIRFITDTHSTHGGDAAEFYELVIKKIVEETNWRSNSMKSVLLIGDSFPHEVGYLYKGTTYCIDWEEEAEKAAEAGIRFDTVSISASCREWYEKLSHITGGVHTKFHRANKTSNLIQCAAYAYGGEATKDLFMKGLSEAQALGDKEMISVYEAYYKSIIE